jgi:hypothetical protein
MGHVEQLSEVICWIAAQRLIQVKELLFDDAYLSKIVDDKKSWFTVMEVINLLYQQFLFTANSLGCSGFQNQMNHKGWTKCTSIFILRNITVALFPLAYSDRVQ